jgi:hypothetical protein
MPQSQVTPQVAHPATPDVPAPGPKPGMSTMDKVNAGVAAVSVGSIVAPALMGGHQQQSTFGT